MRIAVIPVSGTANSLPSTRIAVLNMIPYLARAGHHLTFHHDPAQSSENPEIPGLAPSIQREGYDLVWFQKVHGPSMLEAAQDLRSMAIPAIFGVCDLVDDAMAEATRATLAVTPFLRSLYRPDLQPRIAIIPDGLEQPDTVVAAYDRATTDLRATLVTSQRPSILPAIGNFPPDINITCVGAYNPTATPLEAVRTLYWRLLKLETAAQRWRELCATLRPGFTQVPWSLPAAYRQLLTSHIGIIPVDTSDTRDRRGGVPVWSVKSENRLTLMMAIGLPVIASPVPAYLPLIRQGENGIIAKTGADWSAAFQCLRNPDERERIGRAARLSVLPSFHPAEQARRLIATLEAVHAGQPLPQL